MSEAASNRDRIDHVEAMVLYEFIRYHAQIPPSVRVSRPDLQSPGLTSHVDPVSRLVRSQVLLGEVLTHLTHGRDPSRVAGSPRNGDRERQDAY